MRYHCPTRRLLGLFAVVGALAAFHGTIAAQTTTGSIRGYVTNQAGAPLPNAQIEAHDTTTSVRRAALAGNNGFYTLAGLTPGSYVVTARRIGSAPHSVPVRVGVGQDLTLDFQLADTAAQLEAVTVVAATPPVARSTEVATNVSQQQVNDLPTSSRNFLDLASLAPGTRVSPDRLNGTGKTFAAGAQPAEQINVFIDGASYKNDIISGGVAGQDASRGNPFPRNAIQEFRIITNNFKAEYQKASSAIITAVTKSGDNEWHGNFFSDLQNENFVALDSISRANGVAKPDYSRYLVGGSLGGPIVRDKLFLFGSYEGNYQNRQGIVVLNGDPSAYPPQARALNGTVDNSPFREHLGFAKLTWVPSGKQQLEVTGNIRHETDTRGFGNQFGASFRPFSSGEHHRNNVYTGTAKHTWFGSNFTNEALVSYQHYLWNQDPIDFNTIIQTFDGNYWVGGNDAAQNLEQNRLSLRDDWTYSGLQWGGAHVIKVGANYDFAHYDMNKQLNENPKFFYRPDNNFQFPLSAQIGFGNPDITQNNSQFGIYAQDDWSPTRRLTINLGVRWDVETGMINRDFVTPQPVRDSITAFASQLFVKIDPSRYFTDGNDRKLFLGAVQPRIGASYALGQEGNTVVFASFGVFYDRLNYNATLDETYRRQHPNYNINFLPPDSASTGPGVVPWDTSYFSRDGLKGLIAAISPPQELFLIPNDLKPPKSNMWSVGVRHDFGSWNGSLTYNGTRSYDGFSFEWANLALNPNTDDCCLTANVPAYQNVLVGNNDVHTWYDAMLVNVQRPYSRTGSWGWGAGIAYTLSKSEAEGGDLFSFPQVTAGPLNKRHPITDDRRHQIVGNWVVDVPWVWGVQFSGLATFSSGTPINKLEFVPLPPPPDGPGGNQRILVGRARSDWFKNVDLRLTKNFLNFNGQQAAITGSVFNVFNTKNYGCFDETFANAGANPGETTTNPNWGKGSCFISDPRRFQLGLAYSF
ncbi:MAG TPA: carboxypeptidase regulatory-like domain-containing protein [Gemmatimonadaceae bacterium]|nr:carboxypeptidase regulatory-like domain-containing protein [Gemmatimonadaceae bacterium]